MFVQNIKNNCSGFTSLLEIMRYFIFLSSVACITLAIPFYNFHHEIRQVSHTFENNALKACMKRFLHKSFKGNQEKIILS